MYDFDLQFETNGRDLEMKMEYKIPTYNHNTSKNHNSYLDELEIHYK